MRCPFAHLPRRDGASHRRWGAITTAVLSIAATLSAQSRPAPAVDAPPPFQVWRSELIAEAIRRGFDSAIVAQALGNVRLLPHVIDADRAQVAPRRGLEEYLARRLTPDLVAQGRVQLRTRRALLDQIERWFGVQRRFVVAIWGAEASYGPYTGDLPVFHALATLAWEPRRADDFRAELFDALRKVQRGHIDVATMRGSWAGAMGQPQFMPSSYLKYAYDFDGDGRRDIWGSTADTLASIANYVRSSGWWNDDTWGREVSVTPAVRARIVKEAQARTEGCGAIRSLTTRRPVADWAADGMRAMDGGPLPRSRIPASLVLTVDARSFLVYRNYESILAYNCSHYYALGVTLLADAIR